MAKTLEQNINQAISDFASIKDKIVEKGVDVPAGTPTRDYAAKVDGVYEAGAQEIINEVDPLIVAENEKLQARLNGDTGASGKIYDKVYDEGYAAGEKSEQDRFWDTYQQGGIREVYAYAFAGAGWTQAVYKPKYSLIPTNAVMMFGNTSHLLEDIYTPLDEIGAVLDLSKCTTANQAFYGCGVTVLRRIDISKSPSCNDVFAYSSKLHTIETLVLSESNTCNHFTRCKALVNLSIEGTIGKNGLNLSWSPLSKASIISVVNALSTTTTGLTVTLRLDAVNAAFETSPGASDGSTSSEWLALAATKSNWTISLINS